MEPETEGPKKAQEDDGKGEGRIDEGGKTDKMKRRRVGLLLMAPNVSRVIWSRKFATVKLRSKGFHGTGSIFPIDGNSSIANIAGVCPSVRRRVRPSVCNAFGLRPSRSDISRVYEN